MREAYFTLPWTSSSSGKRDFERIWDLDKQEQQDLAVALALGELDPNPAERAQAMVAKDPELTELVRQVREAVDSMRSDTSVSAPMQLREMAKGLMSRAATTTDWLETLTTIVASWVPKPSVAGAQGYRGQDDGGHLEYTSDTGTVHLMISPPEVGEARWRVRGSIQPRHGDASEVAFVRVGEVRQIEGHGRVERDGKFRVDVPRGVFNVRVRFDDTTVEIRELRIG